MLKILVVGGGGREHALAWKLSQEAEVICAPGNPGIAEDVDTVNVKASDFDGLIKLAKDRKVDLVVVGPEDPLVAGLANTLRDNGICVYGPGQAAAQLEASKAFSKELMFEADIPTAEFLSFHDPIEAKSYARQRFADGHQVVVKASGNALGKGVVVCESEREAEEAIDQMMVHRSFGTAGEVIVVEDRLRGPEFSLLTIVGDDHFVSLPVAQDHKRALDGDLGPNTGGMGTITPLEWVSDDMIRHAEARIVAPIIRSLKERGILYRGTIFSGLMVDKGHIYCLEYNVRFGDPETQSVMLRLGNGLANALFQAANGEPISPPEVLSNAAATVVMASGGYPAEYRKGLPISIDPLPVGVKLFHAGTGLKDGQLVTNGGRVLAVSAAAPTLPEARALAYQGVSSVHFEASCRRQDIGVRSENLPK
jgi:phosphoribosylamine--glycine ligase